MKNVEYTLAEFHAIWSINFIHNGEIDIFDWANIHDYIELYQIKESLAILIRTRYFDSRINFLNKKFLIAVLLRN